MAWLESGELEALRSLNDDFAARLRESLVAYLRRQRVDVRSDTLQETTYGAWIAGPQTNVITASFTTSPLRAVGALQFGTILALSIVGFATGGRAVQSAREPSQLELAVMNRFLGRVLNVYGETWRPVLKVSFKIDSTYASPQFLANAMAPNEAIFESSFTLQIEGAAGVLALCLPASAVKQLSSQLAVARWKNRSR